MARSPGEARSALSERLQARRPEIEQVVLTRILALAKPGEALDPEYADGLRAAVTAALDYGLAAVRAAAEAPPPIPAALFAQVRLAARNGIGLDTVLRRYFAGYTLLTDLLLEEAAHADLMGEDALQQLIRSQASLFDRLLAAVSEEYLREESSQRSRSSEQRRIESVERLLAGELVDTSKLGYDFDLWHLGLIANGVEADEAVRDLAASLAGLLLLVRPATDVAWAWLGARDGFSSAKLESLAFRSLPSGVSLAAGEAIAGISGWRITHGQAKAALPIATRSPGTLIRYAGVALLASMLQDDLLATSLRELYLVPLAEERDGGEMARTTLRAYFAAGRNASSAAATLGVSRQAVTHRLRAIEQRLGRPLSACAIELEAALDMEALDSSGEDLHLANLTSQRLSHG